MCERPHPHPRHTHTHTLESGPRIQKESQHCYTAVYNYYCCAQYQYCHMWENEPQGEATALRRGLSTSAQPAFGARWFLTGEGSAALHGGGQHPRPPPKRRQQRTPPSKLVIAKMSSGWWQMPLGWAHTETQVENHRFKTARINILKNGFLSKHW